MRPSDDEKSGLKPVATTTYGIESLNSGLYNPYFLLTLAVKILEFTSLSILILI